MDELDLVMINALNKARTDSLYVAELEELLKDYHTMLANERICNRASREDYMKLVGRYVDVT